MARQRLAARSSKLSKAQNVQAHPDVALVSHITGLLSLGALDREGGVLQAPGPVVWANLAAEDTDEDEEFIEKAEALSDTATEAEMSNFQAPNEATENDEAVGGSKGPNDAEDCMGDALWGQGTDPN